MTNGDLQNLGYQGPGANQSPTDEPIKKRRMPDITSLACRPSVQLAPPTSGPGRLRSYVAITATIKFRQLHRILVTRDSPDGPAGGARGLDEVVQEGWRYNQNEKLLQIRCRLQQAE